MKVSQTTAQTRYEQRQRALEALQATCRRERITDSCVCSAAAYLFALAAMAIGWSRDEFIGFARAVWDDLDKQIGVGSTNAKN